MGLCILLLLVDMLYRGQRKKPVYILKVEVDGLDKIWWTGIRQLCYCH